MWNGKRVERKKEASGGSGGKSLKKASSTGERGRSKSLFLAAFAGAARGINMHFVSLRTSLWNRFPRPFSSRVSHRGSAGGCF